MRPVVAAASLFIGLGASWALASDSPNSHYTRLGPRLIKAQGARGTEIVGGYGDAYVAVYPLEWARGTGWCVCRS